MKTESMRCPHCNHEIELSEVLAARVEEKASARIAKLKKNLGTKEKELEALGTDLAKRESELEARAKERVAKEREALKQQLRRELESAVVTEVDELKQKVELQNKALETSRAKELTLLRKTRELEDKEQRLEIEVEEKLLAERKKVEEVAVQRTAAEYEKKAAERESLIDELSRQLADMKRRADQGSQQAQGEALELQLEAILKDTFPEDTIVPVPKGTCGGDLIHDVGLGNSSAGRILWEAKRTKSWNNQWLEKLREDARACEASVAILVSDVLPKGAAPMAVVDGVWVVEPSLARGLAVAIRQGLLDVARMRITEASKDAKAEILYRYLTGPNFKQRVEGIVEAFTAMREDLEREKRAVQKTWKSRERQIDVVINNTIAMYGDIQGVVGLKALEIKQLEFAE